MTIVISIIFAAVSVGIIFGGLHFIKKTLAGGIGSQKNALNDQIAEYDKKLSNLEQQQSAFISKAQLDSIRKLNEEVGAELEQTTNSLKLAEQKLEIAQKNVVSKENHQQQLKGIREEEHGKLEELSATHETLSSASMGLERELADSMKQLDSLQAKIQLTDKQKEVFQKLSEVLSATGERMRDLISEYNGVNSRLAELKEQYKNLEEEYTRLVEQQLTNQ